VGKNDLPNIPWTGITIPITNKKADDDFMCAFAGSV
jgi:hypothetical protein